MSASAAREQILAAIRRSTSGMAVQSSPGAAAGAAGPRLAPGADLVTDDIVGLFIERVGEYRANVSTADADLIAAGGSGTTSPRERVKPLLKSNRSTLLTRSRPMYTKGPSSAIDSESNHPRARPWRPAARPKGRRSRGNARSRPARCDIPARRSADANDRGDRRTEEAWH